MGPICRRRDREGLQLLAARLTTSASALLIDHADIAVAHMFWFAAPEFEAFVGFVDELVAPHDFLAVVQVCVKETARQVVRLAGLPEFWPGAGLDCYSLPDSLLKQAHGYLSVLAGLESKAQEAAAAGGGGGGVGGKMLVSASGGSAGGDEGVVALLQGQTVALLLKEFGSKLGAGSGAGGRAGADGTAGGGGVDGLSRQVGDEAAAAGGGGGGGGSNTTTGAAAAGSGLEAERLQCLRALMVLVELLGSCLGSHALQVCGRLGRCCCGV